MPLAPWIDRNWTFDFATELYPCVLERLRGTPARLGESLRGLSHDALVQRDGAHWSMQEHAGHLLDLEDLLSRRLDEFLAGAETLVAADMTNRRTEEADHNARNLIEILADFREARAGLMARLEALEPDDFARTARHPRLERPMRLVDMCLFHADHDDHHLAAISALKRRTAAPQ